MLLEGKHILTHTSVENLEKMTNTDKAVNCKLSVFVERRFAYGDFCNCKSFLKIKHQLLLSTIIINYTLELNGLSICV